MSIQSFDIYGLVLILVLAVAVPLVGIWDFRRLVSWIEEGRTDARTRTYRWILAVEWTLALGFTGWWLAAGRSLEALRLVPATDGWQWLAVGLGVATAVFFIGQLVVLLRKPDALRKMSRQAGEVASLGPQSDGEIRLFAVVSITAGICEEIVYRGALLAVLVPVVGTWPAVALSSVIFGLGHAYQGAVGIAKTAAVGLVMALLAVFTGSLFVPMVLHAVIDLTSGRLLAEASRLEAVSEGAPGPAC